MEWLTELVKRLSLLTLAGAAFVTSGVLIFGPMLVPSRFDTLPEAWRLPMKTVLLFSGAVLLFALLSATGRRIAEVSRSARRSVRSQQLSSDEERFLGMLGQCGDEPMDLDRIGAVNDGLVKLHVIQIVEDLADKGLVQRNPFGQSLVSLTDAGRKRVLELSRQQV
jgi:hypothetical protein